MVCLYYIIKRKEMIHIATELKTSITYTGTGSQKLFDIPFDYLRTSFVKTNVDDIVLTYGEDYVIINRQIEFTVAPISGSHVVIYRETTTDRLVSWTDASVLKASDMTLNQVQQLHIIEEKMDWITIEIYNFKDDTLVDVKRIVDETIAKVESLIADLSATSKEELLKLLEQVKKWALVAEDAALINCRWPINEGQPRATSKPMYGLDSASLILNVPKIVKINVVGDSNPELKEG